MKHSRWSHFLFSVPFKSHPDRKFRHIHTKARKLYRKETFQLFNLCVFVLLQVKSRTLRPILASTNQSRYGINKCKEPVKLSNVDNPRETEPSLITVFLGLDPQKSRPNVLNLLPVFGDQIMH